MVEVPGGIGPGLDCAVMPTKFPDIVLVSTIDFFYPLVLDPYLQGKIGCANVLSDLYAMGISNCDNMLMVSFVRALSRHFSVRFPFVFDLLL